MPTMDKINISQIGLGYWGPNLLRNVISNERCNLISVVDKSEDRLEYAKNQYPDVDVSTEIRYTMEDQNVDAIIIATPATTHFDIAIEAMKCGKHVLVEKPMAMSVREVEEIEKLSNENNLVAMAGHTFLYNNAV